jgi:uncharacterized protein (TIGR02001 family)
MNSRLNGIAAILALVLCIAGSARADDKDEAEKWHAPFGGTFSANFTLTSDYTYAGMSNNARQPAFQPGLDYRTPDLFGSPQAWLYLSLWGSSVVLPAGAGGEVDVSGGVKIKATDKLRLDFGYVRVSYPGFAPELSYNYGDFNVNVDYDLGFATVSGRLRFSPDGFGDSGWEFNKRAFVSVPLDFLKISDTFKFKAYGSVGNLSVERYLQYGIPSPDYWYWQFGLVTSAYGVSMTVAYTDSSIEPSGCANTNYCAGRVFAAITKVF